MAQWDARDPRWLVEDRPDGTNVGQWHWQDRNVLPWSRDDITARLASVSGSLDDGDGGGVVTVTKVVSVEGEAYLATRKGGKKFAGFELSISLDWEVRGGGGGEGTPPSTTAAASGCGTLKISEVSASSVGPGGDPDDVLFEASGGVDSGAAALKALKPGILRALEAYAAALNEL